MADHTREIDVKKALARSGGKPETPASNRRRLTMMRANTILAKNGNARGDNGRDSERVSKSI